MKENKSRKNERGITLIALVVTIVVLLILAAVSIGMLTGENGIITQTKKSKEQTERGEEKEYINLAFSTVKANKIAKGDYSGVTSEELQNEINNYTDKATVTGSGTLKVTYTSGRSYEVDGNGNIILGESYDGMYSVGGLEGKIAPEDLFEYEIIDAEAKTARILRIKPEYCNIEGYNPKTDAFDLTSTEKNIIYNGEQISDMLVLPYQTTIDSTTYQITEASIKVLRKGIISTGWQSYIKSSCPNVNTIIYPNSITYIANIGEGDIAYYGSNVKRIVFPKKLEVIENYAFCACTNLEDIEIPDSVTEIGEKAFYDTAWYNNQPEGNLYIGKVYYEYKGTMPDDTDIEIKEGTISINQRAFYECTGLTNITIPNSVIKIGFLAFGGCTGLTSIIISNSVTNIGDGAFYGCTGLTNITIPNSVISIGDYAFYGCTGLTSITIPNSVTGIGNYAFEDCTGLTSITVPDSVTSIGSNAFDGWTSSQTINVPFKENELPSGWSSYWNSSCDATINYLQ